MRGLGPAAVLALAPFLAGAGAAAAPVRIGGDTTRAVANGTAFAQPAANMPLEDLRAFTFGNRLFNTTWVVAPASVAAFDGLGPTYNRNACSGCHTRDGRGRPPAAAGGPMLSMLVRLSVPGSGAHGGPKPHPAYGDQLNDAANPGIPREGRVIVEIEHLAGRYGDGTPYDLARPLYRVVDLAFGPLGAHTMLSPRVAPAVIGLGLLENVPADDIRARADPDDRDGDGVSGRANLVWDAGAGRLRLGRFGWKANQSSLRQQNAAALNGDIGLTTALFPDRNCPPPQAACRAAVTGGAPEVSESFLDRLTFYTATLAVPARRDADNPSVRRGEALFAEAGCAACHAPSMRTAADAAPAFLANQTFAPYTDLLLHDMGSGLADGRPDFAADGREWRTPPLWGIGLVETVNGHTRFLHDGRARSLAEAILWHGGEAKRAEERFRMFSAADRAALIAFLKSL